MRYGNKMTSAIILILIFACITLVLLPESHHLPLPPPPKTQAPDWFMYATDAFKTDENGKIKGRVKSPKLFHYEANDVIIMQQPLFTLFDNNTVPWNISAKIAHVYQGHAERIELYGQVLVKQLPGKGSNEVTMTTDYLTYFPNTSEAKTNAPVIITQPDSIIRSIGLEANLKQSIINFLKQSQVEYHDENASANKF